MKFEHTPVLLEESINGLNIKPNGIYVDCTTGGAGHSLEIAKRLKKGRLICFDKDADAIEKAKAVLKKYINKIIFIQGSFADIKIWLNSYQIEKVDGIIADLGVSSYQIDNAERGFSYMQNARLDMRMNQLQSLSAYDVVNEYSANELEKILFNYGEEKYTKAIVRKIIKARTTKPIETTYELKEIIVSCYPFKLKGKPSIANKVFQAIRIEVNNELDELQQGLNDMIDLLDNKGRIAIITFHSLEDRIAKNIFKTHATDCLCPPKMPICTCKHKADLKLINKKPIVPSEKELSQNTRSESAKLRIVQKI